MRKTIVVLAFLVGLVFGVQEGEAKGDWMYCFTYEESSADWVEGFGAVCAGRSGSCTECGSPDGTWCVSNSPGVCENYPG